MVQKVLVYWLSSRCSEAELINCFSSWKDGEAAKIDIQTYHFKPGYRQFIILQRLQLGRVLVKLSHLWESFVPMESHL